MTGQIDAETIQAKMAALPRERLDILEVFAEIGSTNSYLLDQPAPLPGRIRVAVAQRQTAGRGRLERPWHSLESSGLCLSMSYSFASRPEMISCLTLASGVSLIGSLENLGADGLGLKWPNDLMFNGAKLGGILTEVRSGNDAEPTIVTGIGINFDLRDNPDVRRISARLGRVSDLASCMRELPSRSTVAAALVDGLYHALAEFDAQGFGNTAAAWDKYDWLRGQTISVDQSDGQMRGVCRGIDTDGALILQTDSGRQRVISGSVSFSEQSGGLS